MIARRITDIRRFMAGLLTGELMDGFLLTEGSVTTFCSFSIDGAYRPGFYGDSEERNGAPAQSDGGGPAPAADGCAFVRWSAVKGHVLNLIRGKRTPLGFQFTFALPPDETVPFLQQAGIQRSPDDFYGFYINFRYDGSRLTLTTAVSLKSFSLDKSHDRAWDEWVIRFLDRNQIECEEAP